jgi:EAL and modified HD-GYP domain-containing signal transduction protein
LADKTDMAAYGGIATVANVEEELRRVGYLARQPILDRRGTVFGYDLLFHALVEAPPDSGLSRSSRGMLDVLSFFGVERFTGGAWGFVQCGAEALACELFQGLPPQMTVLGIPPCDDVPASLVRECVRLKEMGFRMALSDYALDDPREELLSLAHHVKVDIANLDSPDWHQLCNQLYRTQATVVADNIHTHDAFRKARAAGVQYFQGFYFCHPELFPNATIPADSAHHIEILRELFKHPLDLKLLVPLVSRDPSLVFRVLRFVNSPLCAVRNPVTSLETALLLLGDKIFRRIATLAIQCALNQDQSPELLRMAQTRAQFCADAAKLGGLDPEEMYLLGMLSLLPAMLQVPMHTILPGLPLRKEICDALAGSAARERCLLSWLEALETNDIAECEAIAAQYGLSTTMMAQTYMKAVEAIASETAIAEQRSLPA